MPSPHAALRRRHQSVRASVAPTLRPSGLPASARGFALLITITLVAFLVLILVTLATLTRVETQVATNSQRQAEARQNALMALNLALGQLQRHAGPDQRVTGTADLQPLATTPNPSPYPVSDPASGTSLDGDTSSTLDNIDAYWSDTPRNRHWTAAWSNGNANFEPDLPAGANPVPVLQSWLVSGNEQQPDKFKPTDTIPGLSLASTPIEELRDSADRPHRILVKATAGVDTAADLGRVVTAPQLPITGAVPGFTGPRIIGHYAWWIGDEGVKARANLDDPYLGDSTTGAAIDRFQIAQRSAPEVIDPLLSPLDPATHGASATELAAFRADLDKIVTTAQLSNLDGPPTFGPALKDHYHNTTIWSRGVLADTREGGLKADLTYLLAQPDLDAFRDALRAAYGDNAVAPNASFNPAINTVSTRYAEYPSDAPGVTSYSAGLGLLGAGTTWEQLWSFYNFSSTGPLGVFNATGEAASRQPTPTQHGLHPIIVQAKLFYRLRIEGGALDADDVNRAGIIYVDTLPQVVLANPYAVDLAPHDYQVVITGAGPQLRFGNVDASTNIDTDFDRAFTQPAPHPNSEPTYNGRIRLRLKSQGIPAGEARVFTLDPDAATMINDRILVANRDDASLVDMIPEYNPIPALTYNTGKSIPTEYTRAALRSRPGQLNALLYMGNDGATPGDHQNLVQYIRFQDYNGDPDILSNSFFIVDPIADGERRGGGYMMIVTQPPTTDNPANAIFSHHQAVFSQLNYRGLLAANVGSTAGGLQGVVETGRTFSKNGAAGASADWFAANLMFRSGSVSDVRWGVVNIGEGLAQTLPPNSIGGPGGPDVGFENLLYDIPRVGRPIRSLGQLQHLSPTGYIPPGVTNIDNGAFVDQRRAVLVNNWQMNYPVSNSYPHPRVRREQVISALPEHGYHYDGSYLWNHVLWDRFHFSTYPQSVAFDLSDNLPNSRYRPFRDQSVVPWDATASFRGDGVPTNATNSRLASKNLLLEGAFNINSTSVEAWKAFFSSLRNVPVGTHANTSAPFARVLTPSGGTASAGDRGQDPDSWDGFRDLNATEIQDLAKEMVMEVRRRGPFLSLADFVNRRLIPGRTTTASTANDPLDLGLAGALQAALDRSVNLKADIHPNFQVQAKAFVREEGAKNNVNHNAMRDFDYRMPHGLVGYPGHLLQADVLSALGPSLSARSDTFTIRTYGDSVNPATGDVTARAWCEAVVQRLPDYIDSTPATDTPAAGSAAETFGRRFVVVSFRWLSPNEI